MVSNVRSLCFVVVCVHIHTLWMFTGRYGEEFVSKRKEKLEGWSNRVARHPVMSRSFVFRHFLTCQDEQVSLSVCVNVLRVYGLMHN